MSNEISPIPQPQEKRDDSLEPTYIVREGDLRMLKYATHQHIESIGVLNTSEIAKPKTPVGFQPPHTRLVNPNTPQKSPDEILGNIPGFQIVELNTQKPPKRTGWATLDARANISPIRKKRKKA